MAGKAVHTQCQAELFKLNKTSLLDVFVLAGVIYIVVIFDSYGDSGQIKDVEVKAGNKDIDMPAAIIEVAESIWGESKPCRSTVIIATAMENLIYDNLGMILDS